MKHQRDALDVGWRNETIDLSYFMRLLLRQFVPLILVPTAFAILGFAYIVLASPMYSSYVLLSVDVGEVPPDTLNAGLVSHITTIGSNEVTLEVIDRLDLDAKLELGRGRLDQLVTGLRDRFGIETQEELSDEDRRSLLAEQVVGGLAVERVGDSTIIQITYTAATSETATEIANAYANAYLERLVGRSRESAGRRAKFLQSRVEEIKQLATSSFQEVQQIRSREGGLVNLDAHVARLTEALSELDEAETSTTTRLLLMEDTNSLEALEAAALQAEGGSELFYAYEEASRTLEQLRAREAFPQSIAQIESSVEQLRDDLDQLLRRTRIGLKQELAVISAQRGNIEGDLERTFSQSSRRNVAEILIAEHQAGVFQNIYADHLIQLEDVLGGAGAVPISVIARARLSFEPSWPNYKFIIVLAGVCGLVLGGAIAMMREWHRASDPRSSARAAE